MAVIAKKIVDFMAIMATGLQEIEEEGVAGLNEYLFLSHCSRDDQGTAMVTGCM
jgi:hypothetical protein